MADVHTIEMSGFFEELKRRKVYRVAVAYVVAAGGIIQLASAAFPAWELPNWALRLVIVGLLIGFPIALILAWAFDMTPEGIRTTPKIQSAQPTHRRRNIAMLVAAGLLISAAAGFFILPHASAHRLDKSIAVLPFENLSDDKENAFFADGIQDDILTNLAKIGDLKVISRTSVMGYREKPKSVREIGKTLGVSAVLEGSVRRDKNRVRLNVQLINANNDEHMWAEEYDRELTDVFAIQTDLSQKIARELQAKLSPNEQAQLSRKPTENGEAYLAFVQARNLFVPDDLEKLKQGEQLFQRALQLDPNFALAAAQLAHLEIWIFHTFDSSVERLKKARALADQALRLQPELPEGHLALGYCYYYGDLDYDRALSEFKIAQNGLPNDSGVLMSLGAIQRRLGQWEESTANFERAAAVSPNDSWVLQNLGINYGAAKNYEAAEKTYDRAIALAPTSFSARALRAQLAINWKGDLSVTERELDSVPPAQASNHMVQGSRVNLLILQRKFPEALALLQKIPDETLHTDNGAPFPKIIFEGVCHFFMNDREKMREAFEQARVFVEQQLRELPPNAGRHAQLGLIYAALERKDDAIREGKLAAEMLPESKDAVDGPGITVTLAQIYGWTGETDKALELIEHSLNTPEGLTPPLLKLDPMWDCVRNDPRFQALIDKYSAKI